MALPEIAARDVVFLYDGSRDGLMCCIYHAVYSRVIPVSIERADEYVPTLFETRLIPTEAEKAVRVWDSLSSKISVRAKNLVKNVLCTHMPNAEIAILKFCLLGYKRGAETPYMLGHEHVAPLIKAEKHLLREAHHYTGFVRFTEHDGALTSIIEPKNFVLPYISRHFSDRFREENFLIYDKTHGAAFVRQNGKSAMLRLEDLELPELSQREIEFQNMWKLFYDTIAIKERINPKLRMTHMPKRFWSQLTEMSDTKRISLRPTGKNCRDNSPARAAFRPECNRSATGVKSLGNRSEDVQRVCIDIRKTNPVPTGRRL